MSPSADFADRVIECIPRLRAYARALTRSHSDADDLVQETLTKALRHHDKFEEGTQIRACLMTILRNTHYTAVKKYIREQPGSEDCVSGSVSVPPVHDLIIEYNEVLAAVERLPTQFREMLTLVIVLGESYESAASISNCAVGTVKSRVSRARQMINQDLMSAHAGSARNVRSAPHRNRVGRQTTAADGSSVGGPGA